MGISWISPLYLAGTLLLALPILLHLVQKDRSDGIRFPSLMFLQQIPLREKRRLEIRNWLLLLLRCLLLLLVVLAFARPFLVDSGESIALDTERHDSVIVLDRSYSMRIVDHWQQAQDIALRLVDEKQARDRIGIVLFDESAQVLSDLTTNADDLRRLLRRQAPGLRATRLRLGLEQATRLLAASNASTKQVLLISDFQAVALEPGEVAQLTRDIELKTFAVEVATAVNATLSAVTLGPSAQGTADEFALTVEVTNHAASALQRQLRLVVNGREIARRDLRVEAGEVVTETFDKLNAGMHLVRGVVSLDDDALALDNHAYFVYSHKQQVPVLIVESAVPRANQSLYVENALHLARTPAFSITRRRWQELQAEDLAEYSVIIVNDASIPGGLLGASLEDFVVAGGGLLVAIGDRVEGDWASADRGFLPGSLSHQVDARPGEAFNISSIVDAHPLLNAEDAQLGVDLSSARVFSYRNLEPGAGDRVLARYSDGGVALLETTRLSGRVLVLTTTLDTHWNDLALQPAFLPFLHQALRYLAAFEPPAQDFALGSVVDVMRYARALAGGNAVVAAAGDADLVVETPSSGEIRLDRQAPLLLVTEPGFYQVHRATPANAEVVLAANINPVESNLKILDVERFVEEIRASAVPPPAAGLLTRHQAVEYEQQQQLWYLMLCVALALMLLEAIAANWIVRKRSAATAPDADRHV